MASIHESVRDRYRGAARRALGATETHEEDCCGGSSSQPGPAEAPGSCCGGGSQSTAFGYSIEELRMLPEGADLALGCGNPTALAGLREGERVLDLGSGGGIDCLLAAARVGDTGSVIGVDMTPEMIALARTNAERAGATNVEFRLGEIEHLPLADGTVDVIVSNCVVNLSPEKPQVLREAHRVLAPGGRLLISDLVLQYELPEHLRANMSLLTGCIAGAMVADDYLAVIRNGGFVDVRLEKESEYLKLDHLAGLAREAGISEEDAAAIAENLRSVSVFARKE